MENMFQTTNQYMMSTITTFNNSNARGTSCHNPPWESLWIKQETLNQQMFLLVGWLCITAKLPISKNGEVIWGINHLNCELTIQVNMEDAIQLSTEALHNFGLNYCSHSQSSSPTQPANLAASLTWRTSHFHWRRWTTHGLGTLERNTVDIPSMPSRSKHQHPYLSYYP